MTAVAFDTTSRTTRAALVKQIRIEQKRADDWRADLDRHPDCADSAAALEAAQDAIVTYMELLAEGER